MALQAPGEIQQWGAAQLDPSARSGTGIWEEQVEGQACVEDRERGIERISDGEGVVLTLPMGDVAKHGIAIRRVERPPHHVFVGDEPFRVLSVVVAVTPHGTQLQDTNAYV